MPEADVGYLSLGDRLGVSEHARLAVGLQRGVIVVEEAESGRGWIFRKLCCEEDVAVADCLNQIELIGYFKTLWQSRRDRM